MECLCVEDGKNVYQFKSNTHICLINDAIKSKSKSGYIQKNLSLRKSDLTSLERDRNLTFSSLWELI